MTGFSDSLTVRILGDSSHLQRELDGAARRITELGTQLQSLGSTDQRLSQLGSRLSAQMAPLQSLSRLFDRLINQAQQLGRVPIRLNIAPALSSLGTLSQAIDIIALKLQSLSRAGTAAPRLPSPQLGLPMRRYQHGGLVSGAAGVDRVPAWLSSGEFVIRQPAVERLGVSFLNTLNQNLPARSAGSAATAPPSAPSTTSTITNLGGITVHVSQPADVNGLIRDLRFQGFALKNRRG